MLWTLGKLGNVVALLCFKGLSNQPVVALVHRALHEWILQTCKLLFFGLSIRNVAKPSLKLFLLGQNLCRSMLIVHVFDYRPRNVAFRLLMFLMEWEKDLPFLLPGILWSDCEVWLFFLSIEMDFFFLACMLEFATPDSLSACWSPGWVGLPFRNSLIRNENSCFRFPSLTFQ